MVNNTTEIVQFPSQIIEINEFIPTSTTADFMMRFLIVNIYGFRGIFILMDDS